MSELRHDLTRPADLTHREFSGPRRTAHPVYLDRLPPCNAACPAGENIQAWLAEAQRGRFEHAWRALVENNPMPAVHGRVCYHPCEDHCNRLGLDSSVAIHSVERYLGDLAIERHGLLHQEAFELAHLVDGDPGLLGHIFARRLTAAPVAQLSSRLRDLVVVVDHVHRQPYGAPLVGEAAADRMPDPPARVGAET